jgi:hypothetical protein
MTDPFEEFEFKPLTEGLGFHKKTKKETKMGFNAPGLDILDSPLNPPLPREISRQARNPAPSAPDSSSAVDEILQILRSKKSIADRIPVEAAPLPETATMPKLKPAVSSVNAMFLDSMLVLAGTLLCMIVLLSITKADLGATLLSENPNPIVLLATLALFGAVTFIYLVTHRIFLGATPGEWAYDQQLGKQENMGTVGYAVGTVIRSLIVIATGIFPLPLLSVIIRKDIVGIMSGTQIFERN